MPEADKFDIVDAQYHLFQKIDAEQCLAVMDALGIRSLLIDEVWPSMTDDKPEPNVMLPNGEERPLALNARVASRRHPGRFKYLLRINHHDPDALTTMKRAAEDPHCLAFRLFCWGHQLDDLKDGLYLPMLKLAVDLDRPVFFQTLGQHLGLKSYLEQVPECRVCLDHLGLVRGPEAWQSVLKMADHRNVSMKWCHADLAFPSGPYPFETMRNALREAVSEFGKERVIWASDASVLRPHLTWSDVLYYVRECELLTVDERHWVLGKAARSFLKWPESGNLEE